MFPVLRRINQHHYKQLPAILIFINIRISTFLFQQVSEMKPMVSLPWGSTAYLVSIRPQVICHYLTQSKNLTVSPMKIVPSILQWSIREKNDHHHKSLRSIHIVSRAPVQLMAAAILNYQRKSKDILFLRWERREGSSILMKQMIYHCMEINKDISINL